MNYYIVPEEEKFLELDDQSSDQDDELMTDIRNDDDFDHGDD